MRRFLLTQLCFVAALMFGQPAGAAETLRLATVKITAAGPLFIAITKGYFVANGIDLKMNYFDSPGPVPVAVASGSVDIGSTGSSAEIYNLAAQGAFRLITSQAHEEPGFRINALAVSNRAAAQGLKTYADLAGHSIGVAQFGGPTQYAAELLLEKFRVDPKTVRFQAMQSNANVLSAVVGGAVDAAVLPATTVMPAAARGDLKIIGWVGDETPWQSSAVFARTKLLESNPDVVHRFVDALREGERDFHDAFTAPDGSRRDMATAPQVLAILGKFTGETEAQVRLGIPYVDRDARLDLRDIQHQIAWFESQGMLKPGITLDQVIDSRFVKPLP